MLNIQNYRQPMVTATGIFLGFMLDFTSAWVKETETIHKFGDVVSAVSILMCLSLLIMVLFRILRQNPPAPPEKFYRTTLYLFVSGISVPFIGFLIVIVHKMIMD